MKLDELIIYKNKLSYKLDILLSNFNTKKDGNFNIQDNYKKILELNKKIVKIDNIINQYMVNIFELEKEIHYSRNLLQTLNYCKFIFDSNGNKMFNNLEINELDYIITEQYNIILDKEKMYEDYLRVTDVEENIDISQD